MPDDSPLIDALARLVDRGVLTDEQARAVAEEVRPLTSPPTSLPTGLVTEEPTEEIPKERADDRRGRLAEVAGYVGAALVAGATIVFLSQSWDQLSQLGRVVVLLAIAAVLAVAGLLVAHSAPGPLQALRTGGDRVRRRLSSTLFSSAAVSAAFAVGLGFDTGEPDQAAPIIAGGLTGTALAVLGYFVAPAAVGQLVILWSAATAGLGTLLLFDRGEELFGFVLLGFGVGWAVLAATGMLHERRFGAGLGAVASLLGAQWLLAGEIVESWIAYAVTALVAAACFAAYGWIRVWPYLAVGVTGATLAVTEFVLDVTGGSLGAAGALLVAGITLLIASALGLRLRRAVE